MIIYIDFFIVTHKRKDHQMRAKQIEGFFYKMLSEILFNIHIINIKISDDDLTNWTISVS